MNLRYKISVLSVVGLLVTTNAVTAQFPPTQRELNGFLLGQHRETLRNQFGEPMQEEQTPDGWAYGAYVVDRPHRAYMVFKFSAARPDYIYSIQIAGDSGTVMEPFIGLVLGDDRAAVLDRIGTPTQIDSVVDLGLEVLFYEGRNYSVELDSVGRVHSIQIFGYEGSADVPNAMPHLADVALALRQADMDALMRYVAPDIEIFKRDSNIRFDRAARIELKDSTSAMARHLYAGPGSLRHLLADSVLIAGADLALRLFENARPGALYQVWSFTEDAPLVEIVFEAFAGEWRIWEVRFR